MATLFSRMYDYPFLGIDRLFRHITKFFGELSRFKRYALMLFIVGVGILVTTETSGIICMFLGLLCLMMFIAVFLWMLYTDIGLYIDEFGTPYEPQRWKIGLPITVLVGLIIGLIVTIPFLMPCVIRRTWKRLRS